jgi:hypothetical protein
MRANCGASCGGTRISKRPAPALWNEQRKDRGSQREATAVSPTLEQNAGRRRAVPRGKPPAAAELTINLSVKSQLYKLSGARRVCPGTSLPFTQPGTPAMASPPRESFGFSLAVFEFRAHGRGLATRSTGRSAHLHGLLPPILSAHGYRLAHLLWYCCRDLFLLSRFLLSGCTDRWRARDNRYRD